MTSVLLIALCALFAGIYAGSESGAYRLNRLRLRREAEAGARTARILQRLAGNMERFVCVTLVATNVSCYVATFLCADKMREFFPGEYTAELVGTLILSPVLLVTSEVLPKTVFQARPNWLLRASAPLLWISDKLFWPLTRLLQAVILFWQKLLGGRRAATQPVVTSQYLHFFLKEGTQEGVITRQQNLMARNIMKMATRPVRKAMVPLSNVRMIPLRIAPDEALRLVKSYNHARLPVYDGQRTHVVGVVLALRHLCGNRPDDLGKIMIPPTFLPADMSINEAFQTLQEAGQTLGIVTDAKGRALGMATMGDMLQEIFISMDVA